MTTVPFTIHVDPEAAKVFEIGFRRRSANKIDILLGLLASRSYCVPTGIDASRGN